MSQTIAPALRFTTICELNELPVGLGRAFRVGGQSVAVFRTRAGKVFAVANECPHKGGPLADGMLAGDQVVCPLHTFRFDSASGECDQPGVCAVATFPVEVVDGFVRVGISIG
ncbi:MAG: nitrite reductase (NAD(P)H) small subunit [Planctomycetaceae bacterium]|nr:nitrite reductase (NAD(P)H) small subunit [Planctomycetaceae bacterium]